VISTWIFNAIAILAMDVFKQDGCWLRQYPLLSGKHGHEKPPKYMFLRGKAPLNRRFFIAIF
jgi:hypothetical protein